MPAETVLCNRFWIGRVLGSGGFGITYAAYDLQQREKVAVKEYFPVEWAFRKEDSRIIPNSQAQEAYYQHGRKKFVEEARTLCKLKDVENVVNVRALFEENGTAYMVMDFLDGYTLSGYLRATNQTCMPYEKANEIIYSVGKALHKIHQHRLLHRDVSPDNIMITQTQQNYLLNSQVNLIDFGAARMYALNSPKSISILVKPGFAPIEQYFRAGNQGPWTDVYALAATYYYLITGKRPPEAPERIAGVEVKPLSDIVPEIPDRISRAVDHALQEQWRQRPQSVRDFLIEMGLVRSQTELAPTVWKWSPFFRDSGEVFEKTKNYGACVLMQVGNSRQRFYFAQDSTLCIGRSVGTRQGCIQIKGDKQVSGHHCKLWYDRYSERFAVQNYSGNKTFTSHGVLEKNQTAYLVKGEWLFIQTTKNRYIFYLEVD